jgi:hypothetical protein
MPLTKLTFQMHEPGRGESAAPPGHGNRVFFGPLVMCMRSSPRQKSSGLYGDARMRFESRSGEDSAVAGDDRMERNRWRYRMRAGARMEFTDNFRAGVQLETGPSGRSSNVTFGDDAGPWGKSSDSIFLGLIYLNWTPTDWFDATIGRQANPFHVTSLVWDGDLAPEGLSQSFKYKAGKMDLFATFGQFVYDDSNPDNPFGAGGFSDAFLFVNQIGGRFNVSKDTSVRIAPALNVHAQHERCRGAGRVCVHRLS